jgi:hypothetical protein
MMACRPLRTARQHIKKLFAKQSTRTVVLDLPGPNTKPGGARNLDLGDAASAEWTTSPHFLQLVRRRRHAAMTSDPGLRCGVRIIVNDA